MDQRLREAWHARERAFPIYPVLHLAPEGLMLGAGTVLVAAQEARQLTSLDGREARVLALLSAAYGKAVAPAVLGNIPRAADAWRRGDDCLAYIHLAHSRLPLCPAPGPDHPGGSEQGRDYEDYVKSVVNPDNPTPRGWGYQLPNPGKNGDPVYFDDCQHATGMMVEAKGKYAGVLAFPQGKDSISEIWLDQSAAQVAAAGGRSIRWYFAEPQTRAFAEDPFKSAGGGRDRIETQVLPWSGNGP